MLFEAKVGLARATAVTSRTTGRGGGTTLPGRLLLRLQADALQRLAERLPKGAAVVSATNGKTTTAKMAASILSPPLRLCRNAAGANLASGVASAMLRGGPADLGLFEVDEAALPAVAEALAPRALVLGNLFRDQLDRYGELELIAAGWRDLAARLGPATTLVSNADDPLVASIGRDRERHIWFGLDDPTAALPEMQHASDSKWCVRCGARYAYTAVYLGHLGDWRCPACGDARPQPSVTAREIQIDGLDAVGFRLCTPAGDVAVRLPLPGVYNVYNALAAAALALELGAGLEQVRAGLERFSAAFGRFERIDLGGGEAVLLLVKNPAGGNEVIRTLAADEAPEADADRAQRPHRRRPRRVLDLGRRLRAARAPDRVGDLLRHARGRDGDAAQVRRGCARPDRGAYRHGRGARPAGRGRRQLVPAGHLHGDARPARPAGAARPGAAVLAGGGMTRITVGHLYPEHLNIYADRGNIAALERRCAWRGIDFEAIAIGPGDALPDADLYYLGGGQDRDQLLIADDIARHAEPLRAAVDDGAGVLAVCGGYQLLGHYYRGHQGDEMRGIGLVDLVTEAGSRRMIGNIMLDCRLDGSAPQRLVGFENHAGRTFLGAGVQPLGQVVHGHGNNGEDGGEGVHAGLGDRHLRARPAAAQEPVAERLADRPCARAAGTGSAAGAA